MIVHENVPVTLVGGGQIGTGDLAMVLKLAPVLVAADGGAVAAHAAGQDPVAVIGDMDSLPDALAQRYADRLYLIPEQDSTDFDKSLRSIVAPLIIAVGFTGGRMDHALAVLHSLLVHMVRPCIVLGSDSVTFVAPPRLALDLPRDTPVSLFPLLACPTRSTGLIWPTDGLPFAPGRRIGTSNAAAGGPVTLTPAVPGMLVILPREHLTDVARALVAAPLWPDTGFTPV